MKKIYQIPEMKVVKVQTARMIAASKAEMYGKNAEGEGLSRRGGSLWDDDDED